MVQGRETGKRWLYLPTYRNVPFGDLCWIRTLSVDFCRFFFLKPLSLFWGIPRKHWNTYQAPASAIPSTILTEGGKNQTLFVGFVVVIVEDLFQPERFGTGQFSTRQFGTGQFGIKIIKRTIWHQDNKSGQFGTKIIKVDNLAPGQFGTRTIWHRTIWHQDNLAPNIWYD